MIASVRANPEYPDRYLPLHLLFDRHLGTGRYSVRILPPAPVVDSFRDDPYPLKLKATLPAVVTHLPEQIRMALDSRDSLLETDRVFTAIRESGEWIDALLHGAHPDVRDCLHDSLGIYQTTNRQVGILLRLHFGQRASELSNLLWESWYSRDGGGHPFLIRRPGVSLVRFVPSQRLPRSGDGETERSLRIVVVTSSFHEDLTRRDDLASDMDHEWKSIETSLAPLLEAHIVEIRRLVDPTMTALQDELREADIYHHFGHGGQDDQTGAPFVILKDSRTDVGKRIYWFDLQHCFDYADRLRLAVLNACSLQRAGLGSKLARIGVPAVIAMQADVHAHVISNRGFTQDFYTLLAAGIPVHAAFSRARAAIWARDNCVEPFVPTLLLSTLDEVVFCHARMEEAKLTRQSVESKRQVNHGLDPLRQDWETACRQEEQGELKSALIRFNAILIRQPDYPGVRDRIQRLKQRINQQKRSRDVADQVRRLMRTSDYVRLREVLADAGSIAQDVELASALESTALELRQDLSKLMAEEEWLRARDAYAALQGAAALIPAGRRPVLPPLSAIENGVDKALDESVIRLHDLRKRKQWTELVAAAEECLHANPGNVRVQALLTEAAEVLQNVSKIRVADSAQTGDSLEQLRASGNWAQLKNAAREALRLQTQNNDARNSLSAAFYHEAEDLRAEERWNEAESVCLEWIESEPDSKLAQECLGKVLLDHAEDAETHLEWDKVRDLCVRALTVAPGDPNAQKLLARADDTLALLRRIRKLS